MISGTGTAPASRSQRNPCASAAKNPAGGSASVFVNTDSPVSNVSRLAVQIEPPDTGVSRTRWCFRNVGRCCGWARR